MPKLKRPCRIAEQVVQEANPVAGDDGDVASDAPFFAAARSFGISTSMATTPGGSVAAMQSGLQIGRVLCNGDKPLM